MLFRSENPAGRATLAVPSSPAWRAEGGTPSAALDRVRIDGWANGYRLPTAGPVSFSYANQWMRWPAVALQVGVIVGAVVLWRSDRPRRARRPDPRSALAGGPPGGDDAAPVPGAVRAGDAVGTGSDA